MTPAQYTALLVRLEKLQLKLSKDLLATCRNDGPERKRMLRRHREEEVGENFDEWLKHGCARASVQFLLRTLYVRVLEDLGLLDPIRIKGQAGWQAFRQLAPNLGRQAFFRWIFLDLAVDFPELFTPGRDEAAMPSEDLCEEIWNLWHLEDDGKLVYEFSDETFDSRFLGDLYQDLDGDVRKRFALLQTPVFVEEFILDYTLEPAIRAFSPADPSDPSPLPHVAGEGGAAAPGEGLRLLDPTVGSGHFLLGAFTRLMRHWRERAPETTVLFRIEQCLESLWGSDINPYAVAIARFRLLLAARRAAASEGVTISLDDLARLPLHLIACDSLVPWEGATGQKELYEETDPAVQILRSYATEEERVRNAAFFERKFHVVVGNPPYITPKDKKKRDEYRLFWPESCHMKYALSVPFTERFFRLAVKGGFVGMITANSFMKRQFGVALIEKVLPKFDLTHVIDTQGAYIPGHGTPTVILFGRNDRPREKTVRAVLGIRGEPGKPEVPQEGKVWKSIAEHVGEAGFENEFVSVADLDRGMLGKHPWSLGGGGAGEVQSAIVNSAATRLEHILYDVGRTAHTGEDEAYVDPPSWMADQTVHLVLGEDIRDYTILANVRILFPYGQDGRSPLIQDPKLRRALWRFSTVLRRRSDYGQSIEQRGLNWQEWSMYFPDRFGGMGIAFAFVSTHNHFVLDRGGKVFNRTAPIIKLPLGATEDDHLDLLGLLNSSALAFWMRQTFFSRGYSASQDGARTSSEAWEDFYEYDSTKLKQAPIVTPHRAERIALAHQLDALATERASKLPGAVLSSEHQAAPPTPAGTLRDQLAKAQRVYTELTERMVALQEDLDWLTYHSYGLLEGPPPPPSPAGFRLAPGHRPFEIALARKIENEDFETEWFNRHGREPVTEFPDRYAGDGRPLLEERLALIEANSTIALLEQPSFKRRWQVADYTAETKDACKNWLLDRVEDLFAEGGRLSSPRPYSIEEITSALRLDPRVSDVLAAYHGASEFDLEGTIRGFILANALPDNPYRLHSAEGIRKLRFWQKVWEMQEAEDQGKKGGFTHPDTGEKVDAIPVPPKFDAKDFKKADYFRIRGKLNVPRERFILFDDLDPQRFGWNGWRDKDRAAAQSAAAEMAMGHPVAPLSESPSNDDPRRCGPVLGLWESLPDLRRWARDAHEEFAGLAQFLCNRSECPCEVVTAWQTWQSSGGHPGRPLTAQEAEAAPEVVVPVEIRIRILERLIDAERGLTLKDVVKDSGFSESVVKVALSALIAEGSVQETGLRPKRFVSVKGSLV